MKNEIKNRYAVNNKNLLVLNPKHKNLIVDGRFTVDKDNRLSYWLNEPSAWRKIHKLPDKITFCGKWNLNSNHDLELILDESKGQFYGDRLTLKGEIISTNRDEFIFEIVNVDKRSQSHIQFLKLGGYWQADSNNQLEFVIKKKAYPDNLVLEGIWQINKNQQVIYSYEKTDLKTKSTYVSALFILVNGVSGFKEIPNFTPLALSFEFRDLS